MRKILLLEYGEDKGADSDDSIAYYKMLVADFDVVGKIDETGQIVKVIKSRIGDIGMCDTMSLGQFGSMAAQGRI